MFRATCAIAIVAFCVFLAVPAPSSGQVLRIACEGTESTGGGTTQYQYTLYNAGANPVTLTLFYVGSMELTAANYTNWQTPAGFTATVGTYAALSGFNLSVMGTTMLKTPHTQFPPQTTYPTPGAVVWSGSAVIPSLGTLTFGFNHPHASMDVEWLAEHPDAANSSQGYLTFAIAGPLGVYTCGYVHGPGTEPVATDQSTWGNIKALYR